MKKKIKIFFNKYSYTWPFVVFSILILFFTRKFIFSPGLILYSEFLESTNFWFLLHDLLNGWGEYSSFGHSNIGLTTSYGLNPIFWILPPGYFTPLLTFLTIIQFFLGHATGKIYIVLSIFLPFVGMYILALYWFGSISKNKLEIQAYSFVAAIVYSISSIMSDRVIAAHLRYNFAHGLFPILLASTLIALDYPKKSHFYIIINGLIVGMLIWLMPHLLTLYIFLIGLYFLIVIRDKTFFFPLVRIGFISIIIGFLLNIHIWLPAIYYSEPLTYIEDPQFLMQHVYYISSTISYMDSFLLTSSYDKMFLAENTLRYVSLGKLILILLGLVSLFIKRGKRELFLVLIAIVGIIFSIGVKYPFETIFSYLFEHVFLFKPFRDMSKFRILYLISISLLIPIVFVYIKNNYKTFFWATIIFFTLFVIATNPAFYSGNFSTSIVPYKIPDKYKNLNSFLSLQDEDFRVAVYPNTSTIQNYSWFQDVRINPTVNSIFNSVIPLSKNLAVSNRNMSDFQSRYLDVIENNIDKEWAVQRLGNARVKYIIVDLDIPKAEDTVFFLDRNKGVKQIQSEKGFVVFEVLNYKNNKVSKHPAVYYFGDISGIEFIHPDISLINLGTEASGLDLLKEKYVNTLVLYNKTTDDLFFTLLKEYNLSFFPEVRFTKNPLQEFYPVGSNFHTVTQKGIMFYNKEIIQTADAGTISKKFTINPGNYKILMSTISTENQSNSFTLKINETTFRKDNFRKKQNSLEWIDFGDIGIKDNEASITIKNNENLSFIVDQLILIPTKDFNSLQKEFEVLIKEYDIIDLPNTTEYITSNKNIHVLSNAYSPYWNICGKQNIQVNFYANGSFCDNEERINPIFIPNKLYQFSLYTSWILFGGSLIALLTLKRRL